MAVAAEQSFDNTAEEEMGMWVVETCSSTGEEEMGTEG